MNEDNQIYVARSIINEIDTGVYFDENDILVMDCFDKEGNINCQAVMKGMAIVYPFEVKS